MALANNLFFLFLFHLLLLLLLLNPADSKCPESFHCGRLGSLGFPLSLNNFNCGLFMVDGCDSETPRIQLEDGGFPFEVLDRSSTNKFSVRNYWTVDICIHITNVSLPQFPFVSFTFSPNLTLFKCSNHSYSEPVQEYFESYNNMACPSFTAYYRNPTNDVPNAPPPPREELRFPPDECSIVQAPIEYDQRTRQLSVTPALSLEWNVSKDCYECHHGGGRCRRNTRDEFYCHKGKNRLALILATCIPGAGVLLLLSITYIVWQRKKKSGGGYFLSRNISSDPSSKSDIECGSLYFGIPIFSYTELEQATKNFDPSKELGDGGFGTVYHGKLRDGREVAIKRLYEHNCRRVEQFLNEIKILTGLRHPNLVSLYGCTSRRSRELLLVYEYIPNGTVADHLHGEKANEAPLTWPVRMNIAIETATALTYLHKSDIIHRDVKTNNILLDSNFCVKVADFGLSRLFPNDVTHISTAPQGTPGYVDPEYHQCYQLTDRSDVYSFGVVLIELISSMPAVDISRHRHEVNLANLAINRIQRCAFDELIDPSLGYDSDAEVTRMTTSVAELAFRCLQLEKDLRPSMDEVLAFLKDIQSGEDCDFGEIKEANGGYSVPRKIPPSPETDDVVLLKNKNFQSSPTAVTDRWASSGSTTASSIG